MSDIENRKISDELDLAAFATAAVLREAQAQGHITEEINKKLMERIGEVMDHMLASRDVMIGPGADGVFRVELVV